jgi:hypothetical protein
MFQKKKRVRLYKYTNRVTLPASTADPKKIEKSILMYRLQQYCTIVKKQIVFSRSCPILVLVLTTVLGRPGRADVKNDV